MKNCYQVYPALLDKKDRGRGADLTVQPKAFGEKVIASGVPGAELLLAGESDSDAEEDDDGEEDEEDEEYGSDCAVGSGEEGSELSEDEEMGSDVELGDSDEVGDEDLEGLCLIILHIEHLKTTEFTVLITEFFVQVVKT